MFTLSIEKDTFEYLQGQDVLCYLAKRIATSLVSEDFRIFHMNIQNKVSAFELRSRFKGVYPP